MKLGGLLKSLAPTIASAAGGPMAGMAVKMAAEKLGVPDATANEIEDLIERQPEKAVLLKQADQDFKTKIREMEIDLESFKTEVQDRQHARETFKNDWTPKVFCILALILYGAYVMTVTLMPHDANDETIISLVLGQLSGILGTCAAFFYSGSSTKR
jgi:DNA-binding helix-hairpin-helix protein with protein kinase domain